MTKIAILPEPSKQGDIMYRAIANGRESVAKTAGAALDALTAQLPADESGTLVIVQNQKGDEFFSAQQQERLATLMARWRAARDSGKLFSAEDQEELNALVDAELRASAERAAAALGK